MPSANADTVAGIAESCPPGHATLTPIGQERRNQVLPPEREHFHRTREGAAQAPAWGESA